MSQISYKSFEVSKQANTQSQGPRVGFFALKNNGDEAIVRILHDSPEDFDIMAVHPVVINGKHRKMNCIRDARDEINACPLCAAGEPIQQRLYIHLLEYVRQDDGSVKPFARVWERSVQYISTLKNLIDEYGPLSDNIFKIKRNGEPGSMDTTYSILYASPNTCNPNIYVKDMELAKNIKSLGSAVIDKNYDELVAFVNGTSEPVPQQTPAPVQSNPEPIRHYEPTPMSAYDTPSTPIRTPAWQNQQQNNTQQNNFSRPQRLI